MKQYHSVNDSYINQTIVHTVECDLDCIVLHGQREVCDVGVWVQDVFGRTVACLFDGEQGGGGYRVVWDADGAAPGVYFYVIEIDGKRCVRSFVVN